MAQPEVTSPTAAANDPAASNRRLMSLDALRGFDMFWILGAGSLVTALDHMNQSSVVKFLAYELSHANWEGLHFYDLIFPLFVFIAGVSMVFSTGKTITIHGRSGAIKRILVRSVLLFALGVFFNGGLTNPWPDVRLMSVLGRIGLAYFFAGILFCFFRPRALAAITVSLLVGYWALMTWVPFPDVRPTPDVTMIARENGFTNTVQLNFSSANSLQGVFIKGVNLCNFLDQKYLPGMKVDGTWDPEGILSTIPAVATCLLGIFAGFLLRSEKTPAQRKVFYLLAFGVAGVALGLLWGLQFPVIKKIWTSSYVLMAGGYSALLLGVFYQIVDVWEWRRWCQPFVWIGMNPITLYLTANMLGGFAKLAQRLVGGDVKTFFDTQVAQGAGQLVISAAGLALVFWFAHFLYQRKVFIRL